MTIKAIDNVLPPATTEYENWKRWMNRIETQLRTMHYSNKRKIEVKDGSTK